MHRGTGTEATRDRQRDVAGKAAHRSGVLQEVSLARSGAIGGLAHHGGLLVAAAADLDQIDALTRQCRHHGAGFIFGEAAALKVGRVQFDAHREARRDSRADAAHDFEHKAHPPLGVTAPLIVALVRQRRQELRDQVSVSTMDLHTVETRRLAYHRGGCETLDDVFDLSRCQLTRRGRTGEVEGTGLGATGV